MESYVNFAYVYDTFMDQEPYDEWADRVCGLIEKYGLLWQREDLQREEPQRDRYTVADLGCGTGKLTELLAHRGYEMIGIDLSEDMLAIAQDRAIASGSGIFYTQQDMRSFETGRPVEAMVSVGDSLNYLLENEDLEAMFRCVERNLLPGGVFVFDFKTVHLYRDVIGERTIAEDRGDCAFIWDNYYDEETKINEYDLAVFVSADFLGRGGAEAEQESFSKESGAGTESGEALFKRFDEVHRQRGYEIEDLRRAAEKAGLIWADAQDVETGGAPSEETERIVAVVKKKQHIEKV